MSDEEKLEAFLLELSALTVKHGIEVYACGCCESVWTHEAPITTPGQALTFDQDKWRYVVK